MKKGFQSRARRQRLSGQTLVEYSLILVTVAIVGIFVLKTLGYAIERTFDAIGTTLDKPTLSS
jgi:Flp pilus assembly pilin Flp